MTSTSLIIDMVCIPIYALLVVLSITFAFTTRAGLRPAGGFLHLVIFSQVRCVGSILMVYLHYSTSPTQGLYTAAYLLQGLGYSFLLVSALALLSTAHQAAYVKEGFSGPLGHSITKSVRLLYIVTIVALTLVIVGYIKSPLFDNVSALQGAGSSSAGALNTEVKVGVVIFIVTTVAFIVLTLLQRPFGEKSRRNRSLRLLLAASGFLLASAMYSIVNATDSNPLGVNVWIKFVFSQVSQIVAAVILLFAAFNTAKLAQEPGQAKITSAIPV